MQNEMIIVTSGSFNPATQQEIEILKRIGKKGKLIVIVHNNKQIQLSTGKTPIPLLRRMSALRRIPEVSEVFRSIDRKPSVCKTLNRLLEQFKVGTPLLFARRNLIDRKEIEACRKFKVPIVNFVKNTRTPQKVIH